jgi:hypothetical protein
MRRPRLQVNTNRPADELWGVPKMIAVLERLDRCRNELMEAADDVFRTLANGMPRPDRDNFVRFYRAGGVTAAQYRAWLRGQFKHNKVPGRHFIRLVAESSSHLNPRNGEQ